MHPSFRGPTRTIRSHVHGITQRVLRGRFLRNHTVVPNYCRVRKLCVMLGQSRSEDRERSEWVHSKELHGSCNARVYRPRNLGRLPCSCRWPTMNHINETRSSTPLGLAQASRNRRIPAHAGDRRMRKRIRRVRIFGSPIRRAHEQPGGRCALETLMKLASG